MKHGPCGFQVCGYSNAHAQTLFELEIRILPEISPGLY